MAVKTVSLSGDLDISRKRELSDILKALERTDYAVIDITNVGYIDSTALGCFIALRKRMAENGKRAMVAIVGANANITKIFQICGLDAIFPLHGSAAEFQQSLGEPA